MIPDYYKDMEMGSFDLVHYKISQNDRTSNQLKLPLLPPKITQQSKVLKNKSNTSGFSYSESALLQR